MRFGLLDEVIAKLISPTMELLDIRVQDQGNITSFEAYLKELVRRLCLMRRWHASLGAMRDVWRG